MTKYKVSVGSSSSVIREKSFITYAESVREAAEKAEKRFLMLEEQKGDNACSEVVIYSIEEL